MKHTIAATLLVCALTGAGCASERHSQYERERFPWADTLAQMTKDDVIALSAAGVSDDVIISQINASGSFFQLSTQDIIDLANAKVSDKVIDAMIKTGEQSKHTVGYDYYPPYYWYAGYPFGYPWYPSFYLGFSVRHPRYFLSHRIFSPRAHLFGRFRSTGRRR